MSAKTTKNFFSCNWNNLLFYFGIFKGLDLFGNWLRVLLCICWQRLCKVYAQLFRFFLWKSAFTSNSIWCFFILPVPVLVLYVVFFASNKEITCTTRQDHGSNNPGILISKTKSNLCYTRGITPNHVTSGGAHLRGLAPGQRSYKKSSQR